MPSPISPSPRATGRTTPSSTTSSRCSSSACRRCRRNPPRRCRPRRPARWRSSRPLSRRVAVELGARRYEIAIGRGLIATAASHIAALTPDCVLLHRHRSQCGAAPPAGPAGEPRGRRYPPSRGRNRTGRGVEILCRLRHGLRCDSRRRGSSGATSSWRSAAAWSATSPALPRRACGAACAWCKFRRPCSRRSIRPSAARRRSIRPMARTSSAPSISPRSCSPIPARWPACRRANSAPATPKSPNTA